MIIQLQKHNINGSTRYVDKKHSIIASQINDKWYFQKNGKMCFTAGLVNMSTGVNILTHTDEYEESLNMLGYFRKEPNKFEFELHDNAVSSYISITSKGNFYVITEYANHIDEFETPDFDELIHHIIQTEDNLQIEVFATIALCGPTSILAASSKDFVKNNLVRVKSSNIWAYGMDIKNNGDKFGTLYIQFKGPTGGPGDAYSYEDVPIKVWNAGISAPSKGHWFWKYIRNNYMYRKLTGDKIGKLPNALK